MINKTLIVIILLLLTSGVVFSQEKPSRIALDGAETLDFDKKIDPDARRIIGNVKLHQDDIYMYCDSVYFYQAANSIKAYGHVHLIKGDSLEVHSDSLFHDGNLKLSKFRGHVKMNDKRIKLYTDSLDYDMNRNYCFYTGGGKIVDTSAILTSKKGFYFANKKSLSFKDSVVVINDTYTINSDTINYNTDTKLITFEGPTTAVNDTNQLYAENGWYDAQRNFGVINKNARYTNNSQTLDCDTLHYDKNRNYGEAFSNVVIKNLKDSTTVTSNYAYYNKLDKSSIVTDSATLIQISKHDTTYLHADTIKTYVDTTEGEYRNIFAYHKVQLFSHKIQMRCDSIAFTFKDSIVRLFGNPVIWSDSSQLKAKHVHFNIVKNELTKVFFKENAIIISENDSIHYNQIKGFKITGDLHNNKLTKANINRRSETIYYLKQDNVISSMNKTRCRKMDVYFNNGKINEIVWISDPEGKILPLKELDKGNMYFKDFEWLDYLRPMKIQDIYIWKKRH